MHLFYVFLIALANNVDNIGVRIAYSIRGIKIDILKNLWISIITFIISSLSALSGTFISSILSRRVGAILSMIILTTIGFWIVLEPFSKVKEIKNDAVKNKNLICNILENPESADIDNSKDIDFKEATFLAIALSINNIGGSLSAGIIGLNSYFIGAFSAALSFIALWSGNYLAVLLNRYKIGNKAIIISGIILIIIGIKQVF
ncbi:manganese efflux pump [Clostridiaceae bacterium UIB06]|uniref:Manganese efflux pump n=1 Tax=Clostridium thailandense TaxID=2794346 RepID=A0A949X3K8_9CLOT|nr:manganese efflux pump [Clostridium thailandense]MBV7274804.1 manganese efflux pump [Clostridium thailandense]MCH5137265.1 manganese efflux pump [Clostridiaceae bacterium UIB06]